MWLKYLSVLLYFREDLDKDVVDARKFTTGAALGTVMGKVFGIRSQAFSSLLDRCPTFVSKDKSLKAKLLTGKTRKVHILGLKNSYRVITKVWTQLRVNWLVSEFIVKYKIGQEQSTNSYKKGSWKVFPNLVKNPMCPPPPSIPYAARKRVQ